MRGHVVLNLAHPSFSRDLRAIGASNLRREVTKRCTESVLLNYGTGTIAYELTDHTLRSRGTCFASGLPKASAKYQRRLLSAGRNPNVSRTAALSGRRLLRAGSGAARPANTGASRSALSAGSAFPAAT